MLVHPVVVPGSGTRSWTVNTQGWHEAWGELAARWPERFAGRT